MLHGTLAELHAADGDERERLAHTVSRLFLRQGVAPQRRPRRRATAVSAAITPRGRASRAAPQLPACLRSQS